MNATYWVNPTTGEFDHSFTEGKLSLVRTISGLPKTAAPGGTLTQEVNADVKIWVDPAQPGKKANPDEPPAEPSAEQPAA